MTIPVFICVLLRVLVYSIVHGLLFILGVPLGIAYSYVIVVGTLAKHLFSNFTAGYIARLVVRNLIFRFLISITALVALPYISVFTFNVMIGVLLLLYYSYIIFSRSNKVPFIYSVTALFITLGFVACAIWALGYVLLLGDIISFDVLLMVDNDSGSPGHSSPDSNNEGTGGSSPNDSSSPHGNSNDQPGEDDIPDRHSLMSSCTHDSLNIMPDWDSMTLEQKANTLCDISYERVNGQPALHSVYQEIGDNAPCTCNNCHATICFSCLNHYDYSDVELSDSPPANDSEDSDS